MNNHSMTESGCGARITEEKGDGIEAARNFKRGETVWVCEVE